MIRLTYVLRRKPEMTHRAFLDYWRHEHAPLVRDGAGVLGIKRYSQLHSLQDPAEANTTDRLRGPMARPYDGVAEFWFDDEDALAAGSSSAAAQEISARLLADEKHFIDLEHSAGWLAYECPQINPTPENIVASPESSILKLFYVLQRPDGQAIEDVQFYWRKTHGPKVRGVAQPLNILRYIQVHRLAHPFNEAFAQSRGLARPDYFGHAELWYDNANRSSDPGAAGAAQLLFEDESHFIDFTGSSLWFGKEHVIVG